MRVSRFKRKLVTITGLVAIGAVSLVSGSLLFEAPSTRALVAAPKSPVTATPPKTTEVPGALAARPTPPTPAPLTSLTADLAEARKDESTTGYRERAYLLHEIGRLHTQASRGFLLDLAERENADPIERLAAVSALARVGDAKALDAIAASTSDALVHAKIKVMREKQQLAGGRS